MTSKRKKFSRGHPSGFVPDYRHTVNSMGEFKEHGCGHADSEDSCTVKRKCIRDSNERFEMMHIPMRVISIPKLSSLERKGLEARLRAELEEIQMFQKKLGVNSVEAVASSSTNRQQMKRYPADSQVAAVAKCVVSDKLGGRQGPSCVTATNSSNNMLMRQCGKVLEQLMRHKFAVYFNTPVDVVKWNIPDYFSIIKHPMDLGTVKRKITSGSYSTPWELLSDIRLTFTNAMTYNPPGNQVHCMACTLSEFFEIKWKTIEKKLPMPVPNSVTNEEIRNEKPAHRSKMRNTLPNKTSVVPSTNGHGVIMKMTDTEKQDLSKRLESLDAEVPDYIVAFLRRHSCDEGDDAIEVDVDALGDDTLFELRNLLDMYSNDRKTSQLLDHPVSKSLPIQQSKVDELHEEDVDIGDNDAPIPYYPPVEIEKDTAARNNTDSTSSSDSRSSSNDSESDDSSSSESEADNASSHAATVKDKLESQAIVGHTRSDAVTLVDKMEKAHLQEVARVAVEAQREAQAAAAAEAKLLRDKERKAARQALLKMEKTVDIDENIQFLKDLEMLQSEPFQSSVDKSNSNLSHVGLGGSRIGGSNPLEKLGLFMKMEEEEDDDIERRD